MKTRIWLGTALAAVMWGIASPRAMASPEYRKDPAVRAAVEKDLKTSEPAEIRRRWGVFADLAGKAWIYQRAGTQMRTWFHLRWVVPGAVMEYALGHCPASTCSVRKAVLVYKSAPAHTPEPARSSDGFSLSDLTRTLSSLTSLVNPDGGRAAFDVLWEDGSDAAGVVREKGVEMDGYEYEYDASRAEVSIRGVVYKAATPAELAATTGYVLPGVTEAAAPATAVKLPAPEPASSGAIAPVAGKTPLRAGLMGVQLAAADPANPFASDVVLQAVQPGSPAAAAGLAAGDVIQAIAGIERPRQGDVLRAIAASAGKPMPIIVSRAGQTIARSATPGTLVVTGPCLVVGRAGGYQYSGECKDGFAHGRGEVSYALQEKGSVAWRYTGEFVRGMPEGRGVLLTPDWTYEGEFLGGTWHGHGKLAYASGRPGFEGQFALGKAAGLKPFAEALFVCTRPDAAGNFECDAPHRAGLTGGGLTPAALLEALGDACPSKRRLPSRTHLVWGCGFGATNAPGAADRAGEGIEARGRGTYLCLEREPACRRTDL